MSTPSDTIFNSGKSYLYTETDALPTDTWQAVVALAEASDDDDAPGLAVVHKGQVTSGLPLVLWIHPGDACESDCDDEDIAEASIGLQHEMGRELEQFGPCDVVVLHRFSSQFAFEYGNRVADTYHQAMCESLVDPRVTHLFGEDLTAASEWLLEHLALNQRPQILLTGAWSHPEHGCVAAVGQALHAAGIAPLQVSWFSPSEPGEASNVWQPPAPEPHVAPKRPKPR